MKIVQPLLLATLLLTGLLSGCGNDADDDVKVDVDGDSATVTSKDGTMVVGGAASIPDGYPDDGVQYPGMKLNYSANLGESGFSMMGTTDDAPAAAAEKIKEDAADKGWTETSNMNMQGNLILVYNKGDRALNISIAANPAPQDDAGKTMVTINVSK